MDKQVKVILAGGAAAVVLIGATLYNNLDNWFSDQPEGPGSGDEMPYEPEPTGPGSGDEVDLGNGPGEPGPGSGDEVMPGDEPAGPGSGDEVDLGNGPGEPGPGSGDEVMPGDEPTGPGSGDEMPTGPGSGDELPPDEPTGPGSGDEMPYEPEPTGPGSGDELPPGEPTGPGSGDEADVVGSCDMIDFGSTCVDYVGAYWSTIDYAIQNCSNRGAWSADPCPQPSMGGCNQNPGNQFENITWHYNYGGDPFDAELAGYAAMACGAAGQTWIGGG